MDNKYNMLHHYFEVVKTCDTEAVFEAATW